MKTLQLPNTIPSGAGAAGSHLEVVRAPVTAIVLTHNEAANIGPCLDSLRWCGDVVVLDSGSSDGTLDMARAARPDVRTFEHPFRDFGDQRNWALDETEPKHRWVLFVDADERITPQLADAIRAAVADENGPVGYYLCYRNIFLGRWLKRCTHFPTWQLRLLRLGTVRYRKMGHGQMEETDGPLGYLHQPYDHFGFSKGLADWIARHNKYSTEEAGHLAALRREPLRLREACARDPVVRRRALKRLGARAPWRPLARFLYTYVLRGGFLDGAAGLRFCLLRLTHEMHISLKMAEARTDAPA